MQGLPTVTGPAGVPAGSPKTPIPTITASQLNVQDPLRSQFLGAPQNLNSPYKMRVFLSGPQVIASGSGGTLVAFDTIDSDPTKRFSTITHFWRVPLTGWYLTIVGIQVATPAINAAASVAAFIQQTTKYVQPFLIGPAYLPALGAASFPLGLYGADRVFANQDDLVGLYCDPELGGGGNFTVNSGHQFTFWSMELTSIYG